MKTKSLITSLIFTFLVITFSGFGPGLTPTSSASSLDSSSLVLEGLLKPELYSGFSGKIVSLDSKWNCKDRRYFWSLKWEAQLDDVIVNYDPQTPDVTTVQLILKDSKVRSQYYKKGGFFCSWSGGEGVIEAGKVFTTINIHAATNEDGVPEFSLEELSVKDIDIHDVEVLYATLFSAKFKGSSDGFADWVEVNLNKIIKAFLKTSLKKRLDKMINDKIKEAVGNKDSANELP